MTVFETKPLQQLRDPARSISYGIVQPGRPTAAGVPIIRVNNFAGSSLDLTSVLCVEPSIEAQYRRSRPRPGDVLLTLVGSIGQVAIAPPEIEGWNLARAVGLIPTADEHHSKWIALALRAPASQAFMHRNANTTVQTTFNLKDLAQLPIPYPAREVREAILSALSPLDDKIELNRRMNETLEAMAQAIFRDWFVDFGPVRRKMAGATDPVAIMGGLAPDPIRAAELAALFPMGFDASDLPVEWDEEPVIEQANWVNGAAYKKMHFVAPGEGLPVIKIAELKAGVTSTTGFTNTDLGNRYRIDDGELLFSWSGNPDTSIDTFIWTGGPAWLNQHIFAVRPNGSRTLGFLFAMLKYLNPTFAEIARDKQTTGLGHVTKEDLKRLRVVVPSKAIEAAFDEIMTPMFQKLQATLLESRTLAETHDYLLPRLMSGEVRVGDVALEIAA